jgi:hypothetical protein
MVYEDQTYKCLNVLILDEIIFRKIAILKNRCFKRLLKRLQKILDQNYFVLHFINLHISEKMH